MSDYTILELFRQEVETQVATIKQCLQALRTQPVSATELDRAAQAVHSLLGSCQLVEMEAASNLVQLVKECFIAAQNRTLTLEGEQIELLHHASDLLLGMSSAALGEFERWMADHTWELTLAQRAISVILSSGGAASAAFPIQNAGEISIPQLPAAAQPASSPIISAPAVGAVSSPVPAFQQPAVNPEIASFPEASALTGSRQESASIAASRSNTVPVLSEEDSSMMDLFRLEVEAQVAILNNGLLALEIQPQSGQELEALMRAAHSIKGAARIVALDVAVNLAHVMEDCFAAAQNKTITLNPDDVDVLLQGVDLLANISQVSDAELAGWLAEHQADFQGTQGEIAAILNPGAKPQPVREKAKPAEGLRETPASSASFLPAVSAPSAVAIPSQVSALPSSDMAAASSASPPPAPPQDRKRPERAKKSSLASEKSAAQDRVVRVSADNLNRIMGLAGESLIEANWLQPFADSMMSLKSRLRELSRNLEQLQDAFDRNLERQEGKEYLEQARICEQECVQLLGARIDELELYARRTANLSDRLYREVISSHMRPFADGIQGFPRMIRDLARKQNKQVKLDIVGISTPVDRDILKKLEAPLTHILRNAVDHGLELPEERIAAGKPPEGTIRLEAFHRGGMLAITVTDDGRGIDRERLRKKIVSQNLVTPDMAAQLTDGELMEFLFLPGFSTAKQVTEISGRGVGLDIAQTMAHEVGGTVRAISPPGKGMSFHFQLPLTLSVVRTLLVKISGKPYAIPLARIDQIVTLVREEIFDVENRQYFTMNEQNIGLIAAHQVLELPEPPPKQGSVAVVMISERDSTYGLTVEKFLGERDLVVRPLDPRLGKVPDISATALLGDGTPVLILDVSDMVRSMDAILKGGRLAKVSVQSEREIADKRKRILVVDDSITVREMERKLLENRGYNVDIAINGVEGWNAVRTKEYDLVITDVDMPRMNGIELIRQIKSHPRLHYLPVIVVSYRDREEDRIQGLEAGADYYLTKSSFQDETMINAVADLIGR
ncbi:MAG: response regulator [Oscillatoria princeps RMCB-10]|jgi:two-component system sensor histidine kinase and response regulator WspE|nr:response regulator [Oscillatoria princeps RMCB-10]